MERTMTEILREALEEIETLQEYYNSQKNHVKEYVEQNIEKYRYGLTIDRFFLKQVMVKDGDFQNLEKEQISIDEIITEYSIEEKDEGYYVTYKLNPEMDFSLYEMDPQMARKEAIKLIKQPSILNESVLMMLMVKFEEAISSIYRFLIEAYPQAYLSDKSINYTELISLESNIDVIMERFVSREIEDFMRLPISEWFKSFKTKHRVTFCFEGEEFEQFKEVYHRRNLVVHNQGKVNDIYINNTGNKDIDIGTKLTTDDEYLRDAFIKTRKILVGTFWGLRKTANDLEELHLYLFDRGYDYLSGKEWDVAAYIYRMLLEEEGLNDENRKLDQINLWIAIKNEKGVEEIKTDVKQLDVSAMKSRFAVAKHALLDEFDCVTNMLEDIIEKEIPARYIEEWPLFLQYRETEQYTLFVDNHKSLFDIKEYEPDKENADENEDCLLEQVNVT